MEVRTAQIADGNSEAKAKQQQLHKETEHNKRVNKQSLSGLRLVRVVAETRR